VARKKHCPDCNARTLEPQFYRGEELDWCKRCRGAWFEEDNINELAAGKDPHTEEFDYISSLGQQRGDSIRQCPDCRQFLRTFHLLPDFHLDIDICPQCRGAWIEHEAFSKILKSSKIKNALERMNAERNWKTWMFQFLATFPGQPGFAVEYNMRPRSTPWMTYALIAINVLIAALVGFDPDTVEAVAQRFGLVPARVLEDFAVWTFITATFLHVNAMHLIGNMYFLWVLGDNVEDALGWRRFLGLYLLLGALAAFSDFLIRVGFGGEALDGWAIGASGAIFGLFGLYAIWFPNARLTFMLLIYQRKMQVIQYAFFFLLFMVLLTIFFALPIGHIAHFSGFFFGLLIGLILRRQVWRENPIFAYLAGPEAQIR